jgi:hypothetical protein
MGKTLRGKMDLISWTEFISSFPPNITIPAEHKFRLPNDFDTKINAKSYPVILKLSYGDESLTTIRFKLRILPEAKEIPFAADEDENDNAHTTIGHGNQSIPKQ